MPQRRSVAERQAAVDAAKQDDIQAAIELARKDRPDLAPVQTYGWLDKLMSRPGEQGTVSLTGSAIKLNPANLTGSYVSPEDIADTLIHEQTHIDQIKHQGVLSHILSQLMPQSLPYGQRPEEMEAFQAEKERRYAQGRPQTEVPSFGEPGVYYIPHDQVLPVDQPVKRRDQ